jgi:hypothetical protein
MTLVQNDDLLESYGELIGNIAASHHWPIVEAARFFGDPTPASAAWPRAWEVDGLALACILRCADACAIDETRAPSFLFALRKPQGVSKRHWTFQNKIYPAKRRDDALIFETKGPFLNNESDDWWLCFDAISVADQELRSSDALLSDRKRQPLLVRRVVGANSPDILAQTIRVEGWKPVNTQPKISDPQSIIERLGGRQLYGDAPIVPIRELIQNAADAIRARRFLDPFFRPTASQKYPGNILIQIAPIADSEDYWVSVEDNGIGMSEKVVTGSLLDFGTSFWSSEIAAQLYPGLPSEQSFRPVGKFGIGFFSIFMYSDVAKVISHEYRGAKDSWNVLTFEHGMRGRGKFSIERDCKEIGSPDTNTRISLRLGEQIILRLGALDTRVGGSKVGRLALLEKNISCALTELVLPLDVRVELAWINKGRVALNDPLLYEKDRKTVCKLLERGRVGSDREWYPPSTNQIKMLIPMECDKQSFGFCGLNISEDPETVLKSVGGFGSRDESMLDPIWGVAEYTASAANREPGEIAAPPEVLNKWIDQQIELIKQTNLSEAEIQNAIHSLTGLGCDVRPVFRVLTAAGPMNLDEFIHALQRFGSAIFPVRSYDVGGITQFYSGMPHLEGSGGWLYLRPIDIKFIDFVVHSRAVETTTIDWEPPDISTIWGAILSRLREQGVQYEISIHKDKVIGKYIGLNSPMHNLSTDDAVESAVVELRIK